MADRTPPLSVEELHALVASGEIDTVVLAFPDMQGRLQGKRFAARIYTTVYELDSPAAVTTKQFAAMRGWAHFAPRVRSQTRVVSALAR